MQSTLVLHPTWPSSTVPPHRTPLTIPRTLVILSPQRKRRIFHIPHTHIAAMWREDFMRVQLMLEEEGSQNAKGKKEPRNRIFITRRIHFRSKLPEHDTNKLHVEALRQNE